MLSHVAVRLPDKSVTKPFKKRIIQINGLLYKFLLGGGREKLKRELIGLPKEKKEGLK